MPDLIDCPGCTDPRSEGTHNMGTKQHPMTPMPDLTEQLAALSSELKTWILHAQFSRPESEFPSKVHTYIERFVQKLLPLLTAHVEAAVGAAVAHLLERAEDPLEGITSVTKTELRRLIATLAATALSALERAKAQVKLEEAKWWRGTQAQNIKAIAGKWVVQPVSESPNSKRRRAERRNNARPD